MQFNVETYILVRMLELLVVSTVEFHTEVFTSTEMPAAVSAAHDAVLIELQVLSARLVNGLEDLITTVPEELLSELYESLADGHHPALQGHHPPLPAFISEVQAFALSEDFASFQSVQPPSKRKRSEPEPELEV